MVRHYSAAQDWVATAAVEDQEEAVGDERWSRKYGALLLQEVLQSLLVALDLPGRLAAVALLERWPSQGEGLEAPWTTYVVR